MVADGIKTAADRRRRGLQGKGRLDPYVMLFPFMALFIFFTIIPILASVFLSFTYFDMVQMPAFVAGDNYARMFLDDDVFMKALSNTLVFALITGPLGYVICLLFAWMINEFPPKLRAFMTFLFYAPTIASSINVIWTFIFSGDSYGLINSTLIQIGISNEPIQWLTDPQYIMTVIIVIQIWLSLGTAFLSFIAGLQNVDPQLYEAGAIDGIHNRWQELIYITIPAMGPQLQFGAVMQIGQAFSVSSVIVQLVGFPSTDNAATTLVLHIMDVGNTRFEMGYASAIAVFLFAIMVLCSYGLRGLLKSFTSVD